MVPQKKKKKKDRVNLLGKPTMKIKEFLKGANTDRIIRGDQL